jgi:cytochrome c553
MINNALKFGLAGALCALLAGPVLAQTPAAAPQAPAGPPVGNAEAAHDKIAMCVGCHGIADYKASFPMVFRVPKLGGQNAAYIVTALHEYQKGDRKHPTMDGIASNLSDQDMADIAAYYSQQK